MKHNAGGYAVVRFSDVNDLELVSECPRHWLIDSDAFVLWPPGNRARPFIENNRLSSSNWKKYAVVVEAYCDTLATARKKADNASYTSEEEEESQLLQTTQDDSSESDESHTAVFKVKIPELVSDDVIVQNDNPEVVDYIIEDIFDSTITNAVHISKSPNGPSTSSCSHAHKYTQQQVKEGRADINKLTDLVSALILRFDDWIQVKNVPARQQHTNELISELPIKSEAELVVFNQKLAGESRIVYISYISTIGGLGSKDRIKRILKSTFTNEFALQCSWHGQRNNIKVDTMISITTIEEYAMSVDPNLTKKDFETIGSAWFRYAKQRMERKK